MKRYGLYPEMKDESGWCITGLESSESIEWLFLGKLSELWTDKF